MASAGEPRSTPARLAVFGPNPLLSVSDRGARGGGRRDPRPRRRPGGLGGADGGRARRPPGALRLHRRRDGAGPAPAARASCRAELRLVETAGASGCYVHDRRGGERELVSLAASPAALPARDRRPLLGELRRSARRRGAGRLQPLPGRGAAAGGLRRASSPTPATNGDAGAGRPLLAAARQRPGGRSRPGQDQRLGAGRVRLRAGRRRRALRAGRRASCSGGAPARVDRHPGGASRRSSLREDGAWELTPPRFERGTREGCGDSMMGALAACFAAGREWRGGAGDRRRRRRRQLPPPRPRHRVARR